MRDLTPDELNSVSGSGHGQPGHYQPSPAPTSETIIEHDFNGSSLTGPANSLVVIDHDANGSVFNLGRNACIEIGHDANGSTFNLGANATVQIGHDANGAHFNVCAGDTIDLTGQSFSSAHMSGDTLVLSNGAHLDVSCAAGYSPHLTVGFDASHGCNYVKFG